MAIAAIRFATPRRHAWFSMPARFASSVARPAASSGNTGNMKRSLGGKCHTSKIAVYTAANQWYGVTPVRRTSRTVPANRSDREKTRHANAPRRLAQVEDHQARDTGKHAVEILPYHQRQVVPADVVGL